MPPAARGFEEADVTFDYALGAAVILGLLVYLTYALIRAERF